MSAHASAFGPSIGDRCQPAAGLGGSLPLAGDERFCRSAARGVEAEQPEVGVEGWGVHGSIL
jgi:hypothetical protein